MYIAASTYNLLGEWQILDAAKLEFTFRENVYVSKDKFWYVL